MLPILVVEDDVVDMNLMLRSLRKVGARSEIFRATDGTEAVGMLTGAVGAKQVPSPCLIFLDINLPKMNGFEFLDWLSHQEGKSEHVVYVLTSSIDPVDSERATDLGAAGCIEKCNDEEIRRVLRSYTDCSQPPGLC